MLRAKLLLEELRKCAITHVVNLPDNSSAALIELLGNRQEIRLVPVTREGEAFAIAAGLWIGGGNPAVLIQNTGFLESGDSFRGTAQRMRIPLLCLITFRGHQILSDGSHRAILSHPDIEAMSRADIDSTALVTEPTLRAWGLTYDFITSDDDLPKVSNALRQARLDSRPVAVLIAGNLA